MGNNLDTARCYIPVQYFLNFTQFLVGFGAVSLVNVSSHTDSEREGYILYMMLYFIFVYTCFKSPHFITKSVTLGYVVSKTPGFINEINSFQPEG